VTATQSGTVLLCGRPQWKEKDQSMSGGLQQTPLGAKALCASRFAAAADPRHTSERGDLSKHKGNRGEE